MLNEYLTIVSTMMKANHRNKDFKYQSIEELILTEGQSFTPPRSSKLPKDIRRGRTGECYANCFHNFTDTPKEKYRYCEGFAVGVFPVLHAWLIDSRDRVIDPTWMIPGTEYFGIEFTRHTVYRMAAKTKFYGIIANNYLDDWSLLKGE